MKSLFVSVVCAGVSLAGAITPPAGFELVTILDGNDAFSQPQMNNCGEIVFHSLLPDSTETHEIYLYDNGEIGRLTENETDDVLADINDSGLIVWHEYHGSLVDDPILLYSDGDTILLGSGSGPRIGNGAEVVFYQFAPVTCASESQLFLYDGKVTQLTFDQWSNQGQRINILGDISWTQYHFCPEPWEGVIMAALGGEVVEISTDAQSQPQGPSINDSRQIVWADDLNGIYLWEDEQTELLIKNGDTPYINNNGNIAFIRFADYFRWQTWLYRDGELLQITDDPTLHHILTDFNDHGEMVMTAMNWTTGYSALNFLRRIRNGDVVLDSVIDELDYAALPDCLTGPGDYDRLCDCRFYDIGHDRDVDLADFATFQNHFSRQVYYYGDGTWGFDPPPPPPPSTCCSTDHGPGCDDEDGEACVCAALPACCLADWTDACVALYEAACGGMCE